MFSIFTVFTQKNKAIVNMYQKELLGCFSEGIKMLPFYYELNWYTVTTYMQKAVAYYSKNILSENKTPSKIPALCLQGLCENGPIYNSQ